ncbi:M20/M25/M40 family metallo-hydrolase [Geomicrobium sediminis]|uniref:Arginine utilization protein RocB n=1 Tax=Geomicrobium sediminis TaxID=1347788 RepID=A0ABS2PBM5_9BACL|nr:M20/M25/M40 family metallo-hydrolase [Geomicrobium sediminis]MBM7632790.1 arginine utilization protein RocB [Geomicrobium sediminis]
MNTTSFEQKKQLLAELVAIPSITGTESEKLFPKHLYNRLLQLDYFNQHREYLHLGESPQSAEFLTALYKHEHATKTVVMMSHFDVVSVENYGELDSIAFDIEQVTEWFHNHESQFSGSTLKDIQTEEYIFGRGAMDMKAGLVIQLSILEKAIKESWPINLVLLTVPDEEVNSAGMRAAVEHLYELKTLHNLDYELFLNSEPVFTQTPGDEQFYVYSGSIGKIMPSVFCYGVETHVGEPLSGLTSTFMLSQVTSQIEYNERFREQVDGEETPLPVALYQKDLQESYSVKTPYRSTSLFNVFLFERSAFDIEKIFREEVAVAVETLNTRAERIGLPKTTVMNFDELLIYAQEKHGQELLTEWQQEIFSNETFDDRAKASMMIDKILLRCDELAPVVITYFSPPYYPAVRSKKADIEPIVELIRTTSQERFNRDVKHLNYFNGISDLSYLAYKHARNDASYERNTPGFNWSYSIPFHIMSKLNAPVLNVGPLGKDAHKSTERLHAKSAFVEVPQLIEEVLHKMFEQSGD